ncbi:hypothetical protein EV361DRAFT_942099 [Lentinula raphanica]|nr:hypothetical protein F5880DRAFT_848361 [Lentinula raphanica]KAJ3964471.1 hypothetical protein EV361DRAFT_942099 [Lentinula raphanica]
MRRYHSRSSSKGSSSSRNNGSEAGKVALSATKFALSSSRLAAEFVPLPGVAAALDGLLAVINAIEKTKANNEQLLELSHHIDRLMKIIQPFSGNSATDSLSRPQTDRIQTLMTALSEVVEEEQSILLHGRLKRFLLQEDIQTSVLNMNRKIKNALDAFTSSMAQWDATGQWDKQH